MLNMSWHIHCKASDAESRICFYVFFLLVSLSRPSLSSQLMHFGIRQQAIASQGILGCSRRKSGPVGACADVIEGNLAMLLSGADLGGEWGEGDPE